MRTVLLTALVASLSGCTSPPKTVQAPAESWVDEQIAQSATAISLSQRQLHQTSTAPAAPAVVAPVIAKTSSAVPVAVPAAPAISTSSQSKPPMISTPPLNASTQVASAQPWQSSVPTAAPSKAQSAVTTTASKDFSVSTTQAPPPVVAPVTPAAKPPAPIATPKPAVPAAIPKPVWIASEGESLRKVITAWSQRAGYTLSWRTEDLDYGIEAPLRFEGSFEEAVASIFHLYDKADRSFIVDGRRSQHRLNVTEDMKKSKGATP